MNHSGIKIIDKGNDGSEWLNLFNLRSEAGGQPARFFSIPITPESPKTVLTKLKVG